MFPNNLLGVEMLFEIQKPIQNNVSPPPRSFCNKHENAHLFPNYPSKCLHTSNFTFGLFLALEIVFTKYEKFNTTPNKDRGRRRCNSNTTSVKCK